MVRGGIDLLIGFALGYLALTAEGRAMGNKIADAAIKSGKAVVQNRIRKSESSNTVQERKEDNHDNH